MLTWPTKDNPEVEDFDLDWSLRLGSDTVTSSVWTITQTDSPTSGTLVLGATAYSSSATKVWLSGGNLGQDYVLKNTVTTAGGRTYDQSVLLAVRAK